ncbi:hemerythrin domain-containing protein [Streptomyces sp. NPDC051940]|uniref:hemerythrin domain-containing protein n=1 Tax=Streptomyces sp. NPDC051940 TaxID=3155675 RepID=UPI0034358011
MPEIDFTMMYVTHDAFRRDLDRLLSAALTGTAYTPRVRAGWENFRAQLLLHHTVEDTALWPRVEARLGGAAEGLQLLAEMEEEHGRLDPLLAVVDDALRNGAPLLVEQVQALRETLVLHLEHEEQSALPLIQDVLPPADWRAFGAAMREAQGMKGAAVYVPWIVDGMGGDDRNRFLDRMPMPVRVLNRLLWEPRYHRRGMWHAPAV